ncbi:class I SAM-dependent methyltransferase [Candidatus Solirubrobacter pratensis]|uniref:class I SAM-dependent methyltransferase n=1 Tax=Candidatus Solirubrobacter pratensis TaxID=1298857 RepID=UPI0003FA1309|nr:class I SAM-dependent methyltransferase [Candidatus Solirubrobacter pratensis]
MTARSESPARHRLSDYRPHAATGIRVAPDTAAKAGYLDGAEAYLLESVSRAEDRSTGSPELAALERDWPSQYHLTPLRTTLFDAFGFAAGDARVLELGAGLGAITRWLGEHCGEVHAVEGDLARAHVARARTADLDNVTIYSGNYSQLDEREAFDVVTLIGVLEYSHLYHPEHKHDPEAAALANLRVARRALKPDGVLVLAIENRLGLKYIAGAREDHTGRRYESLHGYPDPTVPVTWSRRDLERLVREAGFEASELYLPFPDYKLATTIVNAQRATAEHHLHNWTDTPAPDRGAERIAPPFSETLAQREAFRAGLAADLSNSHLVLAYAGGRDAAVERLGLDTDWVARHWSRGRRSCFAKRVTLRETAAGPVAVNDRPGWVGAGAGELARELGERYGVGQRLADEPYLAGDLLIFDVLSDVSRHGLGASFTAHVARFDAWLDERFGIPGLPGRVRGEALDATWWNVVVDPADGAWSAIDLEWRVAKPLRRDFVLWRMLSNFAMRYGLELQHPFAHAQPAAFAQLLLEQLGRTGFEAFGVLEQELQAIIAGPQEPAHAFSPTLEPEVPFVLCMAEQADADALRTWAGAVAPGEASLVLYGPGADERALVGAIEAAIAAAEVDLEQHDLVLMAPAAAPDADAAVRELACAVLTPGAPAGPFAGLPSFGPGDIAGLRRFLTGA